MVVHTSHHPSALSFRSKGVRFLMTRATGLTAIVVVCCGVLVAGAGAIHLYLWQLAYRQVATIGPLFLLQFVLALLTAGLLVLWRSGAAIVAGILLSVGTLLGFLLASTVGLFGFTLPYWTVWADLALADELVVAVLLIACGAIQWRDMRSDPLR